MPETPTPPTRLGRLPFFSSLALSSKRKGWGTPRPLFDALCLRAAGLAPGTPEIPRPWVDPCALEQTRLVPRFFSPEDNGLVQPWRPPLEVRAGLEPGVLRDYIFSNPPYGDPEEACRARCKKSRCPGRGFHLAERLPGIEDWVLKGLQEALAWGMRVEMLLPYRASEWWGHIAEPPPGLAELAGDFILGRALPGRLSPLNAYWPVLESRLYRWRWLEVEINVLRGRQKFVPEEGSTVATTGEAHDGKGGASFDSAVVMFRGLDPDGRTRPSSQFRAEQASLFS